MSKLTPEQAWQHVKALWPDVEHIRKSGDHWSAFLTVQGMEACVAAGMGECIDWGDLDRYPPAEPQYREPTPADVGKMVEVRDHHSQPWKMHGLLAALPTCYHYRFVVDTTRDTAEATFDYFSEARIADQPTQPCPIDEANTARLAQLKEPTHPDAWPIKTAPQDRLVWLWMGGRWLVGRRGVTAWVTARQPDGTTQPLQWDYENQPTHWRPIE